MNERIKELVEQAKDYAQKHVAECKHYGYYMEHNEYDIRFAEKFAELIVQETIKQMAIRIAKAGDEQSNNPAWYKAEQDTREHFGVEE